MSSSAVNRSSVHLAVVMPHSFFNGKEYQKKMYAAANGLARLEFTVGVFTVFSSTVWVWQLSRVANSRKEHNKYRH